MNHYFQYDTLTEPVPYDPAGDSPDRFASVTSLPERILRVSAALLAGAVFHVEVPAAEVIDPPMVVSAEQAIVRHAAPSQSVFHIEVPTVEVADVPAVVSAEQVQIRKSIPGLYVIDPVGLSAATPVYGADPGQWQPQYPLVLVRRPTRLYMEAATGNAHLSDAAAAVAISYLRAESVNAELAADSFAEELAADTLNPEMNAEALA